MTRIVIVGAGIVGQATDKGFAHKRYSITYVDIHPQPIAQMRAAGLEAMTAAEVAWNAVDVVMLAVPTPTVNDKIILDHIEAAAEEALEVGRRCDDGKATWYGEELTMAANQQELNDLSS